MTKPLTPAKAPCKSCPYRRDVPSGVWHHSEYVKLPQYDGTIPEQVMNGGLPPFMCHQQDGHLCAGWVGCHGPHELVALRLSRNVDPSTFDYTSPVPLFSSGAEAAAHGIADIEEPGEAASKVIDRLTRKRKRKGSHA